MNEYMTARTTGRLTALKIEKANRAGMYADGGGLYLRVTPEGTKQWVLRFMLNRRARWMGLGPLALYGLQEARAKAHDARTPSTRDARSVPANGWKRPSPSRSSNAPRLT
jgi:hypothetical protein